MLIEDFKYYIKNNRFEHLCGNPAAFPYPILAKHEPSRPLTAGVETPLALANLADRDQRRCPGSSFSPYRK